MPSQKTSHRNTKMNKTDLLKTILKIPIQNNAYEKCSKEDTKKALMELKKVLKMDV